MLEQLNSMIECSERYDQDKHDYVHKARDLAFDNNAQLVLPKTMMGSIPPLKLTPWAWEQVFSKTGPAVYGHGSKKTLPTDYLLAIPASLLATNMNTHFRRITRDWMVRGYKQRCRAVLSGDYPLVSNTELIQAIVLAVSSDKGTLTDAKVIRNEVSPDTLHLSMRWKDITGTNYGLGVYLGNGEIGNFRIRLFPMIQRTSCQNSIIHDHENGLEVTHRGNLRSIMIQIKAAFGRIFHASAEMIDQMIEAEGEKVPDFSDVLNGLAIKYRWNNDMKLSVIHGTEGERTRAGIVNGISYAAHDRAAGDERTDMEILAGEMLVAPPELFGRMARVYQRVEDK
jgi:hypothetical protein